jgi:ribosomal protein S1
LSAKIAERQRKLNEAIKEANANRKQAFADKIDPKPVAKVKQTKVESKSNPKISLLEFST